MRSDLLMRSGLKAQLTELAKDMQDWEYLPRFDEQEAKLIRDAIQPFDHAIKSESLRIAGIDGSGDYPSLTYADSFIYVTTAQATLYAADPICGLKEQGPLMPPILEFVWLPESEEKRKAQLNRVFEALSGHPIEYIIEKSDYRNLKATETGKKLSVQTLKEELIRPHASDSSNLGIQLRTLGELGAALRLMETQAMDYMLYDSTLSLPFVNRVPASLFHEHLKRLCCVVARERGVKFIALSKSHGLPSLENIEQLAAEKLGAKSHSATEHWYLRLPTQARDGWEMSVAEGRRLPPPGAVSYLFRSHRNTPVMRIDMDQTYWEDQILGVDKESTCANEQKIFQDIDYACHDQRCYGYPYPIKASHNRASLTEAERVTLRKLIVDSAVASGMKRNLFKDASQATGHR